MKIKKWISIFFAGIVLTGCSDTNDPSIEISGLNYTDVWITTFLVNGYYASGVSPNGGGGSFVCCVTIPRMWRPGLKVTVRWTADERVPNLWKERIVEVPKYTERDFGTFAVHFYPDDTVKVLVTTILEGHPNYPYPRPK